MSERTWSELAEIAEKTTGPLGVIIAALCRHNQGLAGGGGVVSISDKPVSKASRTSLSKRPTPRAKK